MTRSSYEADDGLSSEVAKLVVRQPPSKPLMYRNKEVITSGVVSLPADTQATFHCETRGGNPAPKVHS